MGASEGVIAVLGGRKVFKREISSLSELRETVRAGLPYSALEAVREHLGLRVSEAAAALHLPPRTIARRRRARKLRADESDRLVRVARIGALVVAALGAEAKATAWLHRPNRALGGQVPLTLLDTEIGSRQVEDVLGRMVHGVAS